MDTTDVVLTLTPNLTDLGAVPTGAVMPFQLELWATGALTVTGVTVTPYLGEGFSYLGEEDFLMNADEPRSMALEFLAQSEGFYLATVRVTTPACGGGTVESVVRARTTNLGGPMDADGDGSADGDDCDDDNGWIWPGAVEYLDGLDNDCDGALDEDGETVASALDCSGSTDSGAGR